MIIEGIKPSQCPRSGVKKFMNLNVENDMPSLPNIDPSFLTIFLVDLLNTPSPTGKAEPAIAFVEQTLKQYPELTLSRTRKGALVARWEGKQNDAPRALTSHVDTLGAMVKEI
jgi:hypothetical protein